MKHIYIYVTVGMQGGGATGSTPPLGFGETYQGYTYRPSLSGPYKPVNSWLFDVQHDPLYHGWYDMEFDLGEWAFIRVDPNLQ